MLAALTLALHAVHPAELWGVVVQSNRWWLLVALGYVLAMFLAGLTPLSGGGGGCEATLVLALTRLGVTLEVSLGAMLLYRALTFWLPLLLSICIVPQLFKLPAAEAGGT